MLYLYIDESGDLGFDFDNKRSSCYFTLTILLIDGADNRARISKAITKTKKTKLNKFKNTELKGSKQSLSVKKYFYSLIHQVPFEIYSLTINKQKSRIFALKAGVDNFYNTAVKLILNEVSFVKNDSQISLIIDKSKGKRKIHIFNEYVKFHIKEKIQCDDALNINIAHHNSSEDRLLQVVDMFAWGIFRKYERDDSLWYEIFKNNIKIDKLLDSLKEEIYKNEDKNI